MTDVPPRVPFLLRSFGRRTHTEQIGKNTAVVQGGQLLELRDNQTAETVCENKQDSWKDTMKLFKPETHMGTNNVRSNLK